MTPDGRPLPFKGATLRAEAQGGVARVVLEQTFYNPYAESLAVTYLMPLPADGAVSGYSFRIGERRIVGEIDGLESARQRFEAAILSGRLAGLLEQQRSSAFTQELGNVPPGAEVIAELSIDQNLVWLAEGLWEWRFPTVLPPRYLGGLSGVPGAEKLLIDVADHPLPSRIQLSLRVGDRLEAHAQPESPTHALDVQRRLQHLFISLRADNGVPLDRDIVIRWPVAETQARVDLACARGPGGSPLENEAFGLLTVVPPRARTRIPAISRDLIILLDTSGSMSGRPLEHAKKIVAALIGSLSRTDRLEMIAFSNEPRRWKPYPVQLGPFQRMSALRWLTGLTAGGGTEMCAAFLEALNPYRSDAQRQVVLVSDGLIGAEQEIVEAVCHRLPLRSRVHAVGVGDSINRSLTRTLARAGRGIEVVVGLDEDPERGASRLISRTQLPVLTQIKVSGSAVLSVAPKRVPDLFGGSPTLIHLLLRPNGGEVLVEATSAAGPYQHRLNVPPIDSRSANPALATLYGRALVDDLELDIASIPHPLRPMVEQRIEKLGLMFRISTRFTSWVAVNELPGVEPNLSMRREKVPQALPYGLSAEGFGLGFASPTLRTPPQNVVIRAYLGSELPTVAKNRASDAPDIKKIRKFSGNVILRDGARIIIQFRVDHPNLKWTTPRIVKVVRQDGALDSMTVEQAGSTPSGEILAGEWIRLLLSATHRMDQEPHVLKIELLDQDLEIVL